MKNIDLIKNDIKDYTREYESAERRLKFSYFSLIAEMRTTVRNELLFHIIQKRLEDVEKGECTLDDMKDSLSVNLRDYFSEQSITVEKVEESYGVGKCWNIIFDISGNKHVLGNKFALRIPDIRYGAFNPSTAMSVNTAVYADIVQELSPKIYNVSSRGLNASYYLMRDYFYDNGNFRSYFISDQY